jgi:dipeptidyl aminopeptidase/acylaminoacyl peptidase
VFTKGAGGNEFNQNYRYDFATGEVTLLTDGKSRNSEPEWTESGKLIAYHLDAAQRHGHRHLRAVAGGSEDGSLVAQVQGGGWQISDWSPDEKQLLVLEYVSVNESYLWLFDAQTGRTQGADAAAGAGSGEGGVWQSEFAKNGQGISSRRTVNRSISGWRSSNCRVANTAICCPDQKWDVDDWALSEDGKFIAYTLNENGASTLHMLEVSARDRGGDGAADAGPGVHSGAAARW